MKYLIDTCVASELIKRRPAVQVVRWFATVPGEDVYLPSIAIGEIQKGISKLTPGDPKRLRLEAWLAGVRRDFSHKIVPFDEDSAILWGRTIGEFARIGRTLPIVDTQIAAIALVNDMTLVTRNVDDMAGMGVPIFNPFAES